MNKLFRSKEGKMILSVVWGLGLATLFKKICINDCVIVKAVNPNEIKDKTFKVKDKDSTRCVKFTPRYTSCPK